MLQKATTEPADSSVHDSFAPTQLKRAISLALELEKLLDPSGWAEGDTFRVRLARAHALSAIDSLTDLVRPHAPSPTQSGVYAIVDGR